MVSKRKKTLFPPHWMDHSLKRVYREGRYALSQCPSPAADQSASCGHAVSLQRWGEQNHNSNLFQDQLLCQDDSATDILEVNNEAAAASPKSRCVFFVCLFSNLTFSDIGLPAESKPFSSPVRVCPETQTDQGSFFTCHFDPKLKSNMYHSLTEYNKGLGLDLRRMLSDLFSHRHVPWLLVVIGEHSSIDRKFACFLYPLKKVTYHDDKHKNQKISFLLPDTTQCAQVNHKILAAAKDTKTIFDLNISNTTDK